MTTMSFFRNSELSRQIISQLAKDIGISSELITELHIHFLPATLATATAKVMVPETGLAQLRHFKLVLDEDTTVQTSPEEDNEQFKKDVERRFNRLEFEANRKFKRLKMWIDGTAGRQQVEASNRFTALANHQDFLFWFNNTFGVKTFCDVYNVTFRE